MKWFSVSVIWLKIISVLFAIFGIVIALFNQSSFFKELFSSQINFVFWNIEPLPKEALLFQQWV